MDRPPLGRVGLDGGSSRLQAPVRSSHRRRISHLVPRRAVARGALLTVLSLALIPGFAAAKSYHAYAGRAFQERTSNAAGSTFGTPSLARVSTSAGTGVHIAVPGPDNSLDFYYAYDGQPFQEQTMVGLVRRLGRRRWRG